MVKLAVTGGLSSGKSVVCHFLKELGAYVISADAIVHCLFSENTQLKKDVVNLLGSEVLTSGKIDRRKIAEKVFDERAILFQLERIIHPLVRDEIAKAYKEFLDRKEGEFFVAEVPLLFESAMSQDFDKTLTVAASPESCIKRFVESKSSTRKEYFKRMERQSPLSEKVKRADFVIENNGTLQELKQKVINLYRLLNGSE